jgi:carbonic anhydrase/acetyltransferase-like protein (isoleucine patch superfamily)
MIQIKHRGHAPRIDPTAYVAPTATLVGDVRIGPRARVMYGAVLDAEASRIEVGEATVICENAVLRASAVAEDQPVLLGRVFKAGMLGDVAGHGPVAVACRRMRMSEVSGS